jgi:hypothetical protein
MLLLAFGVETPKPDCTYLGITPYREGTILQLLSGKVRQHIGKVSRDVGPGSERNRVRAVATDRHFSARDIEIVFPTL